MAHNRLLYNRHPMITPNRRLKKVLFRRCWHSDNSFYLDDPGAVDYLVIAGSPEWRIGSRMEDLFRFVLANRVPCAFIAVGAGSGGAFSIDDRAHGLLRRVLDDHCELVTVRDEAALEALRAHNPQLLPCTALFSSRTERLRTEAGAVGLVFQNCTQRFNSVRPEVHSYLVTQYRRIMEKRSGCRVICHTCEDFLAARRAFPGADIRYSAFAEDLEEILDPCSLVIGPRVHGAGLAASMGIPGILVRHSARGLTGWGFLSVPAEPGDDLNALMERIDIPAESSKLLEWKRVWMDRTLTLLRERTSLVAGSPR